MPLRQPSTPHPGRPSRASAKPRHLVLYDGVCGFCDRSVQFLLRVDRRKILTFAPLQGVTGRKAIERLDLPADLRTLIFIRNFCGESEQVGLRSTGALQILAAVGGFWRAVSWLRMIPRPLRDAVYRWIAAHRYRWFGRFDACKIPDPGQRSRFLD